MGIFLFQFVYILKKYNTACGKKARKHANIHKFLTERNAEKCSRCRSICDFGIKEKEDDILLSEICRFLYVFEKFKNI